MQRGRARRLADRPLRGGPDRFGPAAGVERRDKAAVHAVQEERRDPTGVENTGTSQASASTATMPKPSLSEVTTTAFAAFIQAGIWPMSTPSPDRSSASSSARHLLRAVVALDLAGSVRPGTAGSGRPDRGRAARGPRPAVPGGSARGRRRRGGRRVIPGRRGRAGRPPSGLNSAREAAAIRSSLPTRRRERKPVTGWRTSVPWKVTDEGSRAGERRAPAREPEVRVDQVEALAAENRAGSPRVARG